VGCAGVCGAFGLPALLSFVTQASNRARLKGRVAGYEADKDGIVSALLRNGVVVLRPLSRLLLAAGACNKICGDFVKALSDKGRAASAETVLELAVVALVLIFSSVFLLTGAITVAVIAVVLAAFVAKGKSQKALAQRESRLVEQIPDVLRALGICFSAGFSLQQAFEQVANDTEQPLGDELKQTSYDINAGKSVEEALSDLEARTNAEDLSFAIIALEIQHRTGGSLHDLLENAADAVVSSADLRRQLGVQTAQARMSAKVVTLLPLVLVAALSLAMDGYLSMFFSSTEGLMILVVAIGMEIIGITMIRKILGVGLD
jgi:tight adherence protein B